MTAETLNAGTALTLVIRAGAGIDTIDVAAASSRGIFVSNCPGKNSIAVAELVLGLVLACDRRIPDQVADLRQGKWNKGEYSKARGLYGRTLGIVGLGQIGREVAARAQAFGMRVLAWSRTLTHEEADRLGIAYAHNPLEVARLSDVVTINVAANRGHEAPGECGVPRGDAAGRVPHQHLARLGGGRGRAGAGGRRTRSSGSGSTSSRASRRAATGEFKSAILQVPGVYGTHHVGASTDQAQVAIAHEVIRIVQAFQATGEVPNVVNRLARSSASHVLVIRHRNRPGVLAHVFGVLAGAEINVEEVENIIYHGAQATLARIHLDGAPGNGALERIKSGNADIISVELSEIDGRL